MERMFVDGWTEFPEKSIVPSEEKESLQACQSILYVKGSMIPRTAIEKPIAHALALREYIQKQTASGRSRTFLYGIVLYSS